MSLARIENDAKRSRPASPIASKMPRIPVRSLTEENAHDPLTFLHPPMLDETGLSSALGWYIDGLKERSNLSIELDIPSGFERLGPEVELAIFRLVQECLTNIHRHSGSKTAAIRIAREAGKIYVEIQDRGKGISAERLAAIQSQGAGVGIRGMREAYPANLRAN